ncbi:MAG: cache domain-containing protein, partial [Spirochaetaceae bacterium]|nr:cache domain-containing protein [Spirochaetaceae bacterium]
MKIGIKLILVMTVMNLIGTGILVGGSLLFFRKQILALSMENARINARESGQKVQIWFEKYLNAVRTVASIMGHFDEVPLADRRKAFNATLKGVTMENTEALSFWAGFEPDALDGLDAEYVNTPGSDRSGRFLSYFANRGGKVTLEALVDYETAAYYRVPLRTGKAAVIEPYHYRVDGTDMLVTSLTMPIIHNGKTVGVVGADIDLYSIQYISDTIKPFQDSATAVFSNSGIVVAHVDKDRAGRHIMETERDIAGEKVGELTQAVREGADYTIMTRAAFLGTKAIIIITPITIADTAAKWAVGVALTEQSVMAPVRRLTFLFVVIGALILAAMSGMTLIIAKTITGPIKYTVSYPMPKGRGLRLVPVARLTPQDFYFNDTCLGHSLVIA